MAEMDATPTSKPRPTKAAGKNSTTTTSPSPASIDLAASEMDPGQQKPTTLPPELDPFLPEAEETDPNWKGCNCDQDGVLLAYFGIDAPYADDDSDDSDYPGLEDYEPKATFAGLLGDTCPYPFCHRRDLPDSSPHKRVGKNKRGRAKCRQYLELESKIGSALRAACSIHPLAPKGEAWVCMTCYMAFYNRCRKDSPVSSLQRKRDPTGAPTPTPAIETRKRKRLADSGYRSILNRVDATVERVDQVLQELAPNRDAQPKLRDCSGALANRAGMLHFAFWTGEDGIRYITMRENAGIGVGRTISVPDAAALLTEKGSQISILEVLKSQAVSINAQLPEPAELCPAKLKDSTKKGRVPRRKGRAPKAPPLIVGGFHCTRPNCHRSFKTQHGLDEHVKGCTRDLPERYKWGMAALEQMQGGKLVRPSTSDSAYGPHSNFKPRVPLKQGWGRKGGRAKPRRFCPAAVQKLTEWFYNGMRGEGAKTKRDRITGKIAARRLIEMKLEQRPIAEDKTMFESSLAKRAQAWLVRFNSKLTKKNKSELTAKVNAELRSHMATAAIERDGLGVSEVQDATAPSDPTQLQVEQANSAEVHERPAKTAKLSKCHGSSDHHAAARTLQPVSGAFVGRKVKKMFDDGVVYEGTVTEFHNDAVYVSGGRVQCGGVVYSVVYEDGDREDLEPDELLPFLVREL